MTQVQPTMTADELREWVEKVERGEIRLRKTPNGETTEEAVRRILRESPGRSLSAIAREIGVTGERVRQIIPEYARCQLNLKHRSEAETLIAFLEAHPEAHLKKSLGGMSMREISEATGISSGHLTRLWAELELPSRKLQVGARTNREFYKTVVRRETCQFCHRTYNWDAERERNWRNGLIKYNACSIRCAKRNQDAPPSWDMPPKGPFKPLAEMVHKARRNGV